MPFGYEKTKKYLGLQKKIITLNNFKPFTFFVNNNKDVDGLLLSAVILIL